MKIAFVTIADIFPECGQTLAHQIIITRKAVALSKLGHEVFIVTESPRVYYEIIGGEVRARAFPRAWRLFNRTLRRLIDRELMRREVPSEEVPNFRAPYDPGMYLRVLSLCVIKRIDVIQAEKISYVYPALPAKALCRIPLVCVEHDIEYQRLADICDMTPHARGYITRLERYACRRADATVTVSEDDKRRLVEIGIDPGKVSVIPHGVDVGQFARTDPARVRKRYGLEGTVIVFHGTLTYVPNAQAAEIICDRIAPLAKEMGIDATFLIVGRGEPPGTPGDNVVFTGAVANRNLPDYIAAADLAVVPILTGGGTRIKILEYFACRVPVISSAKGAEGIPVRNGEEIVVAESPEEFADRIRELLDAREKRDAIEERAYRFVEKLDWLKIAGRYVELYERLKR